MYTTRAAGPVLLAVAALALSWPQAAHAQSINSPTTINYTTSGSVTIGDTNASAFTVNLVPGGFVSGSLSGYHSAILAMSGGTINGILNSFGTNTLNVAGGAINSYLSAYGSTLVNFSGGSVGVDLNTQDNSIANVTGGTILRYLAANGANTVINFSGGTVDVDLTMTSSGGVINYRGGTVVGQITAVGAAGVINIYGTNLTKTARTGGGFFLNGTLADGTVLNNKIGQEQTGGKINLIAAPEPSAWASLTVGAFSLASLAFRARRRSIGTNEKEDLL